MKIGEKEITFKPNWTRGDQKAYNQLLYLNSKVGSGGKFELDMTSFDNACDLMIKLITGLSDQEIADLDNDDYAILLDKCGKLKDGSGS